MPVEYSSSQSVLAILLGVAMRGVIIRGYTDGWLHAHSHSDTHSTPGTAVPYSKISLRDAMLSTLWIVPTREQRGTRTRPTVVGGGRGGVPISYTGPYLVPY